MDCKNDLKTQRVKRYFLEAAKQIILEEGVEGVSARKISKIAGYSYATTYNYFKDINELLGETKTLMVADVANYMQEAMRFPIISIENIKMLIRAYVQYYILFQNCRCPDSELSSPFRVYSVTYSYNGIEVVVFDRFGLGFSFNCPMLSGIFQNGNDHFFDQFSAFKDVF